MKEGNHSDSSTSSDNEVQVPRKKKRYCRYNTSWEASYDWVKRCTDSSKAYCTLCRREFLICYGGENDLKQHAKTSIHINAVKSKGKSSISSFFASSTGESDKVAAAEVSYVFHTIKHGLSYNGTDCLVKLNSSLFNDSNTVKKIHMGRTKAEMIAINVLGPKTVSDILEDISNGKQQYFAIATDASNKGNRKMFPLCVRYFTVTGVKCKLLDFYESCDETATGINEAITNRLLEYHLDPQYITSYSADNANVNYGKHHSVYTLLCSTNSRILKANCPAHIIHNASKHACDQLPVDIETLVMKVYSHFSVSASRREELKGFFEFLDLEWREILRHVCTRWLSLHRAVERLLQNWPAVTSYFRYVRLCTHL